MGEHLKFKQNWQIKTCVFSAHLLLIWALTLVSIKPNNLPFKASPVFAVLLSDSSAKLNETDTPKLPKVDMTSDKLQAFHNQEPYKVETSNVNLNPAESLPIKNSSSDVANTALNAITQKQNFIEKTVALELPSSDADYLKNPPPLYPRMSKRLGEQGVVIVRALIGINGQAEKAEIYKSSGYERLDQAALDAVTHWRYVPGKRHGRTESMWFNIPVKFELN